MVYNGSKYKSITFRGKIDSMKIKVNPRGTKLLVAK